ncbi:class I SAM-dependent methyltransferase [Francisella uliginis]|uniref:Class I SAM-dependent methyltransferase n=1 Tax=Francisella uliginis TaxID=573570 RepID=A0A1L4BU72_9GAMM|nr:class I SAM-dependent methyltransferase [Francisella uliginis]API87374.1 hypothetical protein F7310_08360 [Francisella uliginis]
MFKSKIGYILPYLCNQFEPSDIILIESDVSSYIDVLNNYDAKIHYISNKVKNRLPNSWSDYEIILSNKGGEVEFYEVDIKHLSSTISPEILKSITPDIKVQSVRRLHSKSLGGFFQENTRKGGSKFLIVDQIGTLDKVKDLDLDQLGITVIAARVVKRGIPEISEDELSVYLRTKNFKLVTFLEDHFCAMGMAVYVRDYKKELNETRIQLENKNKELQQQVLYIENEKKTTKSILEQASDIVSKRQLLLICLAEIAQYSRNYDEAIRYWQQVASSLEENMPQFFYERLSQAYKRIGAFPKGTNEEEFVRGTDDRYKVLQKIHQILNPKLYLEVGVETGRSLVLATCRSIGIDPMPRICHKLEANHEIVQKTSDVFFATNANEILTKSIDFAFIDGMHLFEYALRDFINIERYSTKDTVIAIDDIYPGHLAQADRSRRTRNWTGDVWKLSSIIEKYRPDLEIIYLDVYPTGLMVVKNLNCQNMILIENYKKIVDEYMNKIINVEKYINREGCVSPDIYFKEDLLL